MSAGRPFRAGLVQLCAGTDMAANAEAVCASVREACALGAEFIVTPEMTNVIEARRDALLGKVAEEATDPVVAALRELAVEKAIHILIGSVALKSGDKLVNRSLLVAPDGAIASRYDKIHMFDVDLDGGESYRESRIYRPGDLAVTADLPWGILGMTVCYDMRFPALYRVLAQAGADVITVPSAFTRQTGAAHWHVLLRARAIETGAFVLAAAQGGEHESGRKTYGHSLAVAPWGEIVAEIDGEAPGVVVCDIDPVAVADARRRIPSLASDRPFRLKTAHARIAS
ncbi:MAG TPA: carbon-nitrogen hydrolase family protein [Aestuariivirgaceae bacterium]|nr:carbon-nitrogen hydrolase family protein [Aestuariivirgaceae bacterium]